MIAVRIPKQKNFMAKLLTTDLFDSFLVEEATVETYNTFVIDGRIHRDFYKDSDNPEDIPTEDFSKWSKIRPLCLDLIKGKNTPLSFKFVLRLCESDKEDLFRNLDSDISPENISFGINIKYTQGTVIVTTGVSYALFTLDKEAEKAWDKYVPSFLESNDIETEIL